MQQDGGKRRHRRGRVLIKALVAGALVVVCGAGLLALAVPSAESSAGTAPIDLARATVMTFDISTTCTGDLQARKQIELRSELDTDTTIVELVAEGSKVEQGELIIKLNGDQIKSQVDEEQLRVESARAELVAAENAYEIQKSENDSKLRQSQLKLDLAKLALEQWQKGEHEQKQQDIALAIDKAQRDLNRLKEKHERNKKLLDEGFLSKDQYDQDEIAMIEAEAALAKALLEKDTYQTYQYPKDQKSKTSDVEEAQAELERVKQQNEIELTSKDAERLNQRRQLAIREERLKKLQTQYAACTMTAPQAGLVVYASSAGRGWMMDDQPFQVGRRVMPRESLIVLPDTSEMMAVVKVHESLAGRIRPGQEASVKIDMLGGQVFKGHVDQIGVMAETSDRWRDPNRREYSVKILLDHAGQQNLKPSMRCEAVITLGRVQDTLAIPLQAVFAEEQLRYVYVPRGSKYARVPVKIGERSDTFAQVSAGIDPGSQVLLRQPGAGEVLNAPWETASLKLVGFELGDDGKPRMIGGPPRGAVAGDSEAPPPAGMADRMRRGPGQQGPGPVGPGGRDGRGRGDRPKGAQARQDQPAAQTAEKDTEDSKEGSGGASESGASESESSSSGSSGSATPPARQGG